MQALLHLGAAADLQPILDGIPYVCFLGVRAEPRGDEITAILPFSDHLIGNPMLPALHGGVIGAFLEITAVLQLVWQIRSDYLPKTVDIGIDYLRSGRPLETYGRAIVTKHGRRVANVRVEAWQEDRGRPIAAAHGHFLLKPRDER